MFEIHVNITAGDLVEAAKILAQALRATPDAPTAPIAALAVTPPTDVNATPTVTAVPVTNVVPTTDSTPPAYTMDQLAKAGAVLAQQGKFTELQGLLAKYSVATIADLNTDLYGAFATDLRGLGAQI